MSDLSFSDSIRVKGKIDRNIVVIFIEYILTLLFGLIDAWTLEYYLGLFELMAVEIACSLIAVRVVKVYFC